MHAVNFDTLERSKELEKAGFTQQQAEAQVKLFKNLMEEQQASAKEDMTLVRADITKLEASLSGGIRNLGTSLRADLEERLKEFEYKMTIKLGFMLAAAIGILAAIIKL